MSLLRTRRLLGLAKIAAIGCLLAASMSAVELATSEGAGASLTVTGTGSSYSAVAINNWVGQVANLYGLSVNYQTSSSVYGLDNFAANQVNFGASEIGYSSGQASQTPNVQYQYLPDVAGATCLMYNVPSETQQPIQNLQLDSQVLAGIFTGTITNWNDKAIAALNPGTSLPSRPIVVVYRTDPSGDNYIFSDYTRQTQPSLWAAYTSALGFPNASNANWPIPQASSTVGNYNFSSFVGQSGSDNASNYVAANPGSITYVETAYALLHGQPCAAVQNASGNFVQPSSQADAIALTHDALYPDLEQNLSGVYTAPEGAAYPISAYSYIITQTAGLDPAVGQVLGKFISFMACQGQISAGQLGYSPIPPNLVQDDFDAITRLPGAAPPPPLTAAGCPNPYLTGAATYVGGPIQLSSGGASTGAAVASSGSTASIAGLKQTSAASLSNAIEAKKHGGLQAAPGQQPGAALNTAVGELAGVSSPTTVYTGLALALLALLIVPPLIFFFVVPAIRRRQLAHAAAATETEEIA
jgi:phosphate transport system substrate-binding protein